MSYDVSALENYTKQNADSLVMRSVLGAKTAQLIQSAGNVMLGVKSSETINQLDTDAVFQAGGTCGWNSVGTTSFTQRLVEVGKIKVQEGLCVKALESKYLQNALPKGSKYEAIPFEQEFTTQKSDLISEALEIAIWQGDKTSANGQLNKFDGFVKIINDAVGVIGVARTAPITKANVLGLLDDVYAAIPSKIVTKPDTAIMVGIDTFKLATMALKDANLFHYSVDVAADAEFTLPGTTIKVVALPGLDGVGEIYAMRKSNMVLATDLLNEEEKFDIWFDKSDDIVKYSVEFKYGVNVKFPDEIVKTYLD